MPAALREAISRFFNPPPGHEAVVMQRKAERLSAAADELGDHHDVFADLVRSMRDDDRPPKRKASKRARTR